MEELSAGWGDVGERAEASGEFRSFVDPFVHDDFAVVRKSARRDQLDAPTQLGHSLQAGSDGVLQ
jgi:hypothetical protein